MLYNFSLTNRQSNYFSALTLFAVYGICRNSKYLHDIFEQ